MRRWGYFLYGVTGHLAFLVTYAYMAGFFGNFLVPKSIDTPSSDSTGVAIVINLALVGLFALQHSVMARPWFKDIWTHVVPQPIERSTYVWLSNIFTWILMWQWRGIDTIVWDVQSPSGRAILWGLFAVGWLLVPAVSLMIDHFDLFGSRHVWLYLQGRPYVAQPFRTPMLYSRIRHPLYIGWAMAFWITPTMTVGHLLMVSTLTLYMVIATFFEERDLVRHFGELYQAYQRRVPRFIPKVTRGDHSVA